LPVDRIHIVSRIATKNFLFVSKFRDKTFSNIQRCFDFHILEIKIKKFRIIEGIENKSFSRELCDLRLLAFRNFSRRDMAEKFSSVSSKETYIA